METSGQARRISIEVESGDDSVWNSKPDSPAAEARVVCLTGVYPMVWGFEIRRACVRGCFDKGQASGWREKKEHRFAEIFRLQQLPLKMTEGG
jgi:hypothetical protein